MSELNVVAVLKAKAGSEAELQAALNDLATASRAEEGNVSYVLSQSAADPTTFVVVETWRSQDDLNAHMQTPHIAEALKVGAELFDGAPAIHPLIPLD